MRQIALVEQWSRAGGARGRGPLHVLDGRAKLAVLLVFLVCVGLTPVAAAGPLVAYAVCLMGIALVSKLPLEGLLLRLTYALPFIAPFALIAWWTGSPAQAAGLTAKSLLSLFAVLLVAASTPLPELVTSLEFWRVPRTLLLVVQFLYRYLFLIPAQAAQMRQAALCRGGRAFGGIGWSASAGALGVLFIRSWERADAIYQAMLARGFQGHFPVAAPTKFQTSDGWIAATAITVCLAIWSVA